MKLPPKSEQLHFQCALLATMELELEDKREIVVLVQLGHTILW